MTPEEKTAEFERLGKIYSQASNNAELENYLGSSHPIFQKETSK